MEENLELGRQLKAERDVIEENLAREREERARMNQIRKEAVVEGRAAVAVAQVGLPGRHRPAHSLLFPDS